MTTTHSLLFRELAQTAQAVLPYLDQPTVVHSIQRASWPVGLLSGTAMAAHDIKQKPDKTQKQQALLRNSLVLAATMIGTWLGAKRWFYEAPELLHTLSPDSLEALSKRYSPEIAKLAAKTNKSLADIKAIGKIICENTQLSWKERQADLAKLFPTPALEDEGFSEVSKFLKLGLASVGSGLIGGMIANYLTNSPKGSNAALVKEGLFQMLVNIGMCGVGAAAGIIGAKAFGHDTKRLSRFLWVSGGLGAGIATGNIVSDWIHRGLVKPMARLMNQPDISGEGPRQVGWQDLLIHVDDLPLMMMFAGVAATKPVIPLCFAYSGLRTGTAKSMLPSSNNRVVNAWADITKTIKNPVFQAFNEGSLDALS